MARPTAPEQSATLSPEAQEFLKNVPAFPVPAFLYPTLSRPSRIPAFRKQFQDGEDVIEEKLIADHGLSLERIELGGVPVLVVTPPDLDPNLPGTIVWNIHGGGFVMGTARERNALLTAAELKVPVYSVEYTLSPEAAYPVAIEQSLTVYRELIGRHDPKRIIGMSASAGVAIMVAVVQRAQQAGLPMIGAIALYAPATDLSGAGDSVVVNTKRDLQPSEMALSMAMQNYTLTADLHDPGVSPLYGEFGAGWPATVINTGTRDIMLSSGIRLYWKLREHDLPTELLVSEGMWHGFHWEPEIPEAIRARAAVRRFVTEHIRA
jgi:monoterpene epsilon-lactone hydrolase